MKIHFASFFGVDFDLDLLPFWSEYYKACRFDSCHVILHREEGGIGEGIKNHFKRLGFSITLADGPFSHGMLLKLHMDLYASSLPKDDLLVIADADEFHCAPAVDGTLRDFPGGEPPDYRALAEKYDIISGWMVDRYGEKIEACYKDPFLQYPLEEPETHEILKSFVPPFLNRTEWPATRRTKILAARAGYDVAYEGSHGLFETPYDARIAPDFRVLHFAWREATKKKLVNKTYYSKDNCIEINKGEINRENLEKRMEPESIFGKVL